MSNDTRPITSFPSGLHENVPWVDPASAFVALAARREDIFWLDSGMDAVDGVSYLGAASYTYVGDAVPPAVREIGVGHQPSKTGSYDASNSLRSGWVGWVGYEAGVQTLLGEAVAENKDQDHQPPQVALLRAERTLAYDHALQTLVMRTVSDTPDDHQWLAEMRDMLREAPELTARPSMTPSHVAAEIGDLHSHPSAQWRHSEAAYLDRIEQCRKAIANGDAYQLCLTNSAVVDGVATDEAAAVYLALRELSPAHHGGFVRARGHALLSSSPEQFVRVDAGGILTTKPIKGTRPRHADAGTDARLATELAADPKERAENVMIVDLLRNDVSRISRPGSVEVPQLREVESYRHVHQLVSTVRAKLRQDVSFGALLDALLPPGSMTGAPKESAVRILNELEGGPRGVYSGTFGWIDDRGMADLAVVIRSIVIGAGHAVIGSGGGITADSVSDYELAEVALKAQPLLQVLRGERSDRR